MTPLPAEHSPDRVITIVLFEGFEALDVFGPVEIFSKVPGLSVRFCAPAPGAIASAQGFEVLVTTAWEDIADPDVLLVPGGQGTRPLSQDQDFLSGLSALGNRANLVTSVCTGSALLAAAGLLDGHRATSNKYAFDWATQQGDGRVDWVPEARWVEDGTRWTSSGVAAGMDMAAALAAHLLGDAQPVDEAVQRIELEVHRDPSWDPFAAIHGTV